MNAWLDEFFAHYYRRRPVNATFIGVHSYDHLLPDYSERAVEETVAEMEGLLARLGSLPTEGLTDFERLDLKLAAGYLRSQLWEFNSSHFHRGNPSHYVGEAVFGVLGLFLTDYAPLEQRVEAAVARLEATPAFLEQARRNIRQAPRAWVEKAIDECDGALALLRQGIDRLILDRGIAGGRLRVAADRACDSFASFQAWLRAELLPASNAAYACGEEAFDLLLREAHCVPLGADELLAYAEGQLAEAEACLVAHAADFGAASPAEALARLGDLHPSPDGYYASFAALWEQARELAISKGLLTWPDFPIRYVAQPAWVRDAAPKLYFLPYRAPAAFHRPPVHDYLVPPLDRSLPEEEQERFLRAVHTEVIKLNHVVHHGGIGHHVQNWHAYRSRSRIGQVAAVDCASRIAMLCGGTMAEGWAVYATGLMAEAGFLTPLEEYAEVQTRRRMCARAVVDIQLHRGVFSLADAERYYQERGGMAAAAAHSEAVKNSMNPGAAMMYLYGCDRIRELRRTLEARLGSRFNLRHFHDTFLSYGSIPVALIAAEMERSFGHV